MRSLNDFIRLRMMAIGSFSSNRLLNVGGWQAVLLVNFALLLTAVISPGATTTSNRGSPSAAVEEPL